MPEGSRSAWAQYTIETPHRNALKAHLQAQGIPTVIYYVKPLHQQVAYNRYPVAPGGLPVSEALPARILCLPMHPYLTTEDQDRVITAISDFIAAQSAKDAAE
jgi:dTDP-4-amino-4,6-dideoxygalactose transaminase